MLCAEDVLVHNIGEATFGKLYADGEYRRVLAENRDDGEIGLVRDSLRDLKYEIEVAEPIRSRAEPRVRS